MSKNYDSESGLLAVLYDLKRLIDFLAPPYGVDSPQKEFLGIQIAAIHDIGIRYLELCPIDESRSYNSRALDLRAAFQRIAELTSAELRAEWFYPGDKDTLIALWALVGHVLDRRPFDEPEPERFDIMPMGEMYGPVSCQYPVNGGQCGAMCWEVYIPVEEWRKMPYRSGMGKLRLVMGNKEMGTKGVGIALCDAHSTAEMLKERATP